MAEENGSPRGGTTRWPRGTVLHALDAADGQALIGLGTRRTFPPGAALITEGAPEVDTFVLLDGCCKVLGNTVDGRAVLLSIRVGGDLVGELAALDDKPRSATVVAATTVVARVIDQQTFRRYLADRPAAATAIHGAVAEELRRATRHRVHVHGAPIGARLALVLDYLAAAYGRPGPDGVHIDVPLSQPELASLIGVSEPSLHRALTDLRSRHVVATRYRRLVVCDPAALRALAGTTENG
jgi:CRP-like cAMP-binding protein